ncbi:MAG: gliding motility-associated C-terminal domain-containing protein [bacterium]|nr:gliding motility-associated C-terminal domain-containing protein [bacterium]
MRYIQGVCISLLSCLLISFQANSQFTENKGQVLDLNQNFHPEVRFYYSSTNAAVYFHNDRVVYNFMEIDKLDMSLYSKDLEKYDEAKRNREVTYHRMDLVFENANPNVDIETGEQLQGVTHFYLNKRNGIRDVASYKTITYKNMYSNIDVVFQNTPKGMKYDVVLHDGANINDVQLKIEGYETELRNGKLVILAPFGEIAEEIPLSFLDDDRTNTVEVEYILNKDNTIGFRLNSKGNYSKLTIDPVLEWASYFNQLIDPASASARLDYISNHVDADGNYFTYGQGFSSAGNYPVVNPGGAYTDVYDASSDLYLAKFDANRALVWATYIGGSGSDNASWGNPITTNGNILHIVGRDISTGAPFTNGGGFYEAVSGRNFWARFNKNTGALQHLTSLADGDHASIAISPSGLVAIVSDKFSFGYTPLLTRGGAYNQATHGGSRDMTLLMFNSTFNQIWGTFLGGPGTQEYFTCAFDSGDNLYFAGGTSWFGGSTAANEQLVTLGGAYNQSVHGGANDIMLGKFNSSGALIWHTLYGGNTDEARAGQMGVPAKVLVHPTTDEVIVATNTTSDNLPVQTLTGAYNQGIPADPDFSAGGSFWNYAGYIIKFTPAGVRNWATYFYSNTNNSGTYIQNITFGGCNKFYVGAAGSQNTLTGAASGYNLLVNNTTSRNGYITMLDDASYSFEWDSYLNSDHALDCHVAANTAQARFFVASPVWYENIPVTDPGNGAYYEGTSWNSSGSTIGLFQFHPSLPPDVTDQTICAGESVNLTTSGGMGAPYNWYATPTSPTILNTGTTYTVSPGSTTTYYVSSGTGICASPRVPVTVTVDPAPTPPTLANNGPLCIGDDLNLTANTISGATYSWTGPNSFSSSNEDPTITGVTAAAAGTYNCTVTVAGCTSTAASTTVSVNTPSTAPTSITGTTDICEGASTTLTLSGGSAGTGATPQWYSGSCGSAVIGSNNTLNVSPTATTTYYVAYSGACNTTSCASVTVNVTPAPGSPAWTTPGSVCEAAGTIDLSTTITGATGGTWSGSGVSGSTFDPTGLSGNINVTYTTGTGSCTDQLTQTISVTPQADPSWTSPGTVCESSGNIDLSATITGDPGGTWTGTGVSGSTFDPTGLAGQSIDITYEVGTAPCEETLMQTIVVETNVTASWTAPADLCESDAPIDLTPYITGSTGGSWSGSGISGSNFDPSGLSGPITITYSVGSGPCSDSQDQTITVLDAPSDPTVSVDNDTICAGETVQISATGSGAGVTYNIYSDAAGTNLIGTAPLDDTPSTTTDYYIEAVNANNCTNGGGLQQITVVVNPLPIVNAGADVDICGSEQVILNATGDGNLVWSDGTTGGQLVVNPTSTTTYVVTATDSNNCIATDDVTVTVNTPSGALIAVDDAYDVTAAEITELDVLGNDTYSGSAPTIIQNPTNGIASVQGNGTISYSSGPEFTGTDTLIYEICDPQCVNYCDTAMVLITVSELGDIVIPGGFSPNGDNINEIFIIEGLDAYPDNILTIFNRWGDVVFEAAPYQNNWDGTSSVSGVLFGDKLPPGTYFYILDLGNGTNAFRGSLELKY